METPTQKVAEKPLGVLDTLISGFELIWLNPWILLVPIALDVFLWVGPYVSAQPVFQRFVTLLTLLTPSNAPTETVENLNLLKQTLQTAGDSMNVLGVLATGMPSVIGFQPPTEVVARAHFAIGDPLMLGGVVVLALIGAVLIASAYLELTARPIRQDAATVSFFARWLRACVDVILLALLVIVGLSVLMFPTSVIAGTLSIANQALGAFLLLAGMTLMFWALLYLAFAVPAIFVSRVNALQAIVNSVRVFRFDFWSAARLILVVYLLRSGFTIIWEFFQTNLWGVVFVVIANAFLNSALIAAEMIFYKDRIARMG
ncbi:MAG: hypothetical protein N2559_05630 [Anaerolineae bacterium]|nr:hypothetical protein [Anaerolineae bacterium]